MADYSTLKAAVAEVVKTNGTQAITGANLQAVLLSIINSVGGGGYIFEGVATPSTSAGTPDQNVFYIGGAGLYANFGTSITVPVGSVGVFAYNGSWVNSYINICDGNVIFPTAKGIAVDYLHAVSISDGVVSYGDNSTNDCIRFMLPVGAVSFILHGVTYTGNFRYFNNATISTDSYIGYNNTGIIPNGAVMAVINAPRSSNAGYDASYLTFEYKFDGEHGGIYDEVRWAANGYRILLNKAISSNLQEGYMQLINSTLSDALIAYIPPMTESVSVTGAVLTSGNYFFFRSTDVSVDSYIGRSSGIVPQGATMCIVNISRENSDADYYKNIEVNYTALTTTDNDYHIREKTKALVNPTIIEGKRVWDGVVTDSTAMDLWVYDIDPSSLYVFSGKMYGQTLAAFYFITYWDESDNFISYDIYQNVTGTVTEFNDALLTIPSNAHAVKMNVQRLYSDKYGLSSVVLGNYYDFSSMEVAAPLMVVVRSDKSFYVRHHVDDTTDGILLFDYYTAYSYSRNCIMQSKYYTGSRSADDATIMASQTYQNCYDSQSPMFTSNFGPMFSNHGYSIPRITIANNPLTSSDIGSEWFDQNNYHYTIGNIDGNNIYLLPVIYTTGVAGEETRDWKWYSSPYPTSITRVGGTGETLNISSSRRWDLQVSQLVNTRVVINGQEMEAGTYRCNEIELAYEQIGYNPIFVTSWFPPVYNGVMLRFDRHFTVSGGNGFLSLTSNTVVNNLYPFPLYHYIDVVPMFPFQQGDYKPHVYIPKMKKVTSDIDFRQEFVSVDDSHPTVGYYRNSTDLVNVDDMPDRAYCYLMTDNGNILYGCAGGHSLIRGMSVKTIRNEHISMNGQVGIWNPPAGNKFYNNVILDTNEANNILPSSFINEFEGYMCWYKPQNGIHCFYHRSKECYVVYIHTNQTISKGYAILPDFMNNLAVDSVVEKTDGIELLTSTVIDGKLFFTSDNSETEFNWIVVKVK